ncbi:MAG: M20/M25/M40 family metallo-hydrolase [Flavipsychrobacter sp.]|nr:M20/M25/M40 family metallo-hydrolase [Flavipsychrobacter sp.]
MKKRFLPLLVFASIVCISFTGGDDEKVYLKTITKIKQEGFNNSKAMSTLFQLTDVIGPRMTGSTGMKKAEAWAKQQLEDWGLQNVQIERWGTFGKGWETQHCYVAMTAPYYQQLIAVPKAWTPSSNGTIKADAIVVNIETVADMAQYDGKLEGKIVVKATNQLAMPNFSADAKRLSDEDLCHLEEDPHVAKGVDEKSVPATNRTVRASRQAIDSFLYSQKAAAVLSCVRRSTMGTVFTSNGASRAWDAKPVLPELEMGIEHLNRIERLLKDKKKVSLELNVQNTFLMNDSTEYNVIAEIPGTDLADEVVMLGAHMDSWHGSTGTTDNGTGTVICMEAVRILKAIGVKPRRTIRIALWSGEEQGLLGSNGYVKKHIGDRKTMKLKPEHGKIAAYYNLDNGAGKIRGIYAQGNDAVVPIFRAWLAPFKDLAANTVTNRNTGSTDHIPFDAIGVPGFQFIQDPLEYGSRTHHTNMDSYDRVNENDLMQASIIMASMVYHTAMRDEMLPRKPLPKKQEEKK